MTKTIATTIPWDGSPYTLAQNETARLAQTPAGPLIFAAVNQDASGSEGRVTLSSGGGSPIPLTVPGNANQFTVYSNNWNAQNLSVANVSPAQTTSIWIEAYGPGMPGQNPVALPLGVTVQLGAGATAAGTTKPNYMWLQVSAPSGLATFGIVGGGAALAYVIAVNAAQTTGPSSAEIQPPFQNPAPPSGYYATTTQNTYNFQFNWNGASVWLVNLSSGSSPGGNATLLSLG